LKKYPVKKIITVQMISLLSLTFYSLFPKYTFYISRMTQTEEIIRLITTITNPYTVYLKY